VPWPRGPVVDGAPLVLVFDTETTADSAQRLLFGSYRLYRRDGKLWQEGLIAADDLPDGDRATLEAYVASHDADTGGELRLWTRAEFVEHVLWKVGYEARALIVGFNLPFDLSRLAVGWAPARARRRRRQPIDPRPRSSPPPAFSLRLSEWTDPSGVRRAHAYRPNIRIQSLGSKRQFISFTGPGRVDGENLVGDHEYFRGRFLDLHTLSYVLTDRSLSLDAAAREFGLTERKAYAAEHGAITPGYVDYNRQDVRVTFKLYGALMAEWRRHPIELAPEQAFSPAAVGKAYLRALGVRPPREHPNEVSDAVLGYSMVAYYGGRSECRIRGLELPVRYVDFASMYPTAFVLLGLWSWVIADHFEAVDATAEARAFVATAGLDGLHDPAAWPALAGVVCRIRPSGELLPVRARYGVDQETGRGNPAWTIGLNHLTTQSDPWYTLADVVAAGLLGGKAPEILEAIRVRPVGRADGLRTVRLRGAVEVDPACDDLFRTVIETRGRLKGDESLEPSERSRLDKFLKVLANAAAYGDFAEFRQLHGATTVSGNGLYPFEARVAAPEEPGEFCFPPLAATITGASRLLLGLAQANVEAAGGSYVACDTDSLLIVSSEAGGLIPCLGGSHRLDDGRPAVSALSWVEVDAIRERLNRLNPYDRAALPDLLKLEKVNDSTVSSDSPDRSVHDEGSSDARLPITARGRSHDVRAADVPPGTNGRAHTGAPGRPITVRGRSDDIRAGDGAPRTDGRAHTGVHGSRTMKPARSYVSGAGDRELYAIATSSKRYVLYRRSAEGVEIVKPSEHGLGLYRPPVSNPTVGLLEWPEWIDHAWRRTIAMVTGTDPGPEPDWYALPAVSQVAITTPALARPFERINAGRPFAEQVKPFGFLLLGHVDPLATVPDTLPARSVAPVAPYTSKPAEYANLPWVDRHSGKGLRVTTRRHPVRGAVRLTTYGDVIGEYRMHPETKSGHPYGGSALRSSVGVLPRLEVVGTEVRHIGKESNRLEEAEEGLDVPEDEAYTEYRDPRAEWAAVLPALRRMREERGCRFLVDASGLSERELRYILNGGKVPHVLAGQRLLALTREAPSPAPGCASS
jgi:hypothetical protein